MQKIKLNRSLVIKISVPFLVLILIAGVFSLKKMKNRIPEKTLTAAESDETDTQAIVQGNVESASLHVISPIDFEAIRSSGLPVIVDFGADSCIPCREMAPVLLELNKSLEGKAIIKFVDVWKYRDLADGIPLQVIPTQIFFDSSGRPFSPPESLEIPFNLFNIKDTNEHVFTTHEGGLDKGQMLAILTAMGMK